MIKLVEMEESVKKICRYCKKEFYCVPYSKTFSENFTCGRENERCLCIQCLDNGHPTEESLKSACNNFGRKNRNRKTTFIFR